MRDERPAAGLPALHRLGRRNRGNGDAYSFPPLLGELDLSQRAVSRRARAACTRFRRRRIPLGRCRRFGSECDCMAANGVGRAPVPVERNFMPIPRRDYCVGVPAKGRRRQILNTDPETYGGSGVGNMRSVAAAPHPRHGLPVSLELTLPPLAAIAASRTLTALSAELRQRLNCDWCSDSCDAVIQTCRSAASCRELARRCRFSIALPPAGLRLTVGCNASFED